MHAASGTSNIEDPCLQLPLGSIASETGILLFYIFVVLHFSSFSMFVVLHFCRSTFLTVFYISVVLHFRCSTFLLFYIFVVLHVSLFYISVVLHFCCSTFSVVLQFPVFYIFVVLHFCCSTFCSFYIYVGLLLRWSTFTLLRGSRVLVTCGHGGQSPCRLRASVRIIQQIGISRRPQIGLLEYPIVSGPLWAPCFICSNIGVLKSMF